MSSFVTCLKVAWRSHYVLELLINGEYVTRPAKINHLSALKLPIFLCLLYHNLIIIIIYTNKMFTTAAEFNGLSSASYRSRIVQSQLKILDENTT